jgi:hypothetical protein
MKYITLCQQLLLLRREQSFLPVLSLATFNLQQLRKRYTFQPHLQRRGAASPKTRNRHLSLRSMKRAVMMIKTKMRKMYDFTAVLLSIHAEVFSTNSHGNVIAKTRYQEQNYQSTTQARVPLRLLTIVGH